MSDELRLVNIRCASRGDWRRVFEWRTTEEIAFQFGNQEFSEEEHLNWVESLDEHQTRKVFLISVNGTFVGVTSLKGINAKDENAEFDIYIAPDYHGRGIGTAGLVALLKFGFGNLSLHRIYAYYLATNRVAHRLYAKVGFRIEGRLRDNVKRNGQFTDSYLISILDSRWKKVQPNLVADIDFRFLKPKLS